MRKSYTGLFSKLSSYFDYRNSTKSSTNLRPDSSALPSPIDEIPDEILTQIFLLSHEPVYPSAPDGLGTLLRVSHKWRTIALSTSGLWCTIRVGSETYDRKMLKSLNGFLARSESPLVLYLSETSKAVLSVLETVIGRWGVLHWSGEICPTVDEWHLIGRAERLTELSLLYTTDDSAHMGRSRTEESISLPSLKRLSFVLNERCSSTNIPIFSCPQLDSLQLSGLQLTSEWWNSTHGVCSPKEIQLDRVSWQLDDTSSTHSVDEYNSCEILSLTLSGHPMEFFLLSSTPNLIELNARSLLSSPMTLPTRLSNLKRFRYTVSPFYIPNNPIPNNPLIPNNPIILNNLASQVVKEWKNWTDTFENMPVLEELSLYSESMGDHWSDEKIVHSTKGVLRAFLMDEEGRKRCSMLKRVELSRIPVGPIADTLLPLARQRTEATGEEERPFLVNLRPRERSIFDMQEQWKVYNYEELVSGLVIVS